jgi:hypothetical protein
VGILRRKVEVIRARGAAGEWVKLLFFYYTTSLLFLQVERKKFPQKTPEKSAGKAGRVAQFA